MSCNISPSLGLSLLVMLNLNAAFASIDISLHLKHPSPSISTKAFDFIFIMDCKEIQPVHSKGDQSWVFFGRNDAKAETPVLWPPHVKS